MLSGAVKRVTFVFIWPIGGNQKLFWSTARVFVPGGGADLEPASFISYIHLLSQSYPGGTVSPHRHIGDGERTGAGPDQKSQHARFIPQLKALEGEVRKNQSGGSLFCRRATTKI